MAFNMYNVPHNLIRRGVGPTPADPADQNVEQPMLATRAVREREASRFAVPAVSNVSIDENGCKFANTPYGKSYEFTTGYYFKSKSITVNAGQSSSPFTVVGSNALLICLKGNAKVVFENNPLRFTVVPGTEINVEDTATLHIVAESTTVVRLVMDTLGDVQEELSLEAVKTAVQEGKDSPFVENFSTDQLIETVEAETRAQQQQKAKEQALAVATAQASRQGSLSSPRTGFLAGVNPMPGQFRDDD